MSENPVYSTVDGALSRDKKYTLLGAHFDVNGKWGGAHAIVAGLQDEDGNKNDYLYYCLGKYGEVGLWPGEEQSHSWFQVVARVVKMLHSGIAPDFLWANLGAVNAEVNKIFWERDLNKI